MQDGRSYRYAIVNAGGIDREDAGRRALECRRRLDFQLDEEQEAVVRLPTSASNSIMWRSMPEEAP